MPYNNNQNDRLADYVGVAERLQEARSAIQSIISEPPVMMTDVMGYVRVSVLLNDGRSSTGLASFRLDLQGRSAQATNPLEDCETSAVGRALGMLGYGSKRSVASREEVDEAERRASQAPTRAQPASYASTTEPPRQTAAPRVDPERATPMTDKQGKAIFAIRSELGYTNERFKDWLQERKYDWTRLSSADASAIIEALRTEQANPTHPQVQSTMTDEDAMEAAITPRNGAAGVGR